MYVPEFHLFYPPPLPHHHVQNMFDFKLDRIMCKICYRLGGTVQISPS